MIIITGGAGMIGSIIAAQLNTIRDDMVIVDHIADSEKWQNLVHRRYAEYLDRDELWAWLDTQDPAEISAVVHMGAISASVERNFQALLCYNLRYSQRLWTWCAAHKKPFLYASSAATYGDGSEGYDDAQFDTLRPLHAYGYSKHYFDQWALRQATQQAPCPPHWAGFKFFNVYGPNEYHKERMASVAFHAFQQFKASGTVRLFKSDRPNMADGAQVRDFVYVKDVANVVVRVLELALQGAHAVSGIYNVGTGKARRFKDLATAVMQSMGEQPHITYIDMPADLQGKYQYFTEAKTERLQQFFADRGLPPINWTPLEDGIADYVQNHLLKNDPYC